MNFDTILALKSPPDRQFPNPQRSLFKYDHCTLDQGQLYLWPSVHQPDKHIFWLCIPYPEDNHRGY